jgi:hypothetical protein
MRHIDSEAIYAPVEPKAQHTIEETPDVRVLPVEVGLALVKEVEIPLASGAIRVCGPRPRGTAKDGFPVIGGKLTRLTMSIMENVTLALW